MNGGEKIGQVLKSLGLIAFAEDSSDFPEVINWNGPYGTAPHHWTYGVVASLLGQLIESASGGGRGPRAPERTLTDDLERALRRVENGRS